MEFYVVTRSSSSHLFLCALGVAKRDMAAVIDYHRVAYIDLAITMVTGFSFPTIEVQELIKRMALHGMGVIRGSVDVGMVWTRNICNT